MSGFSKLCFAQAVGAMQHCPTFSLPVRSEPSHLRRCRILKGMRQADLAERAGCSRDTIARLEAGKNQPQLRTALAIAAALGAPVEAIFPGSAPPGGAGR